MATAILILLVALVVIALFVYALCSIAARSDEQSLDCYSGIMAAKDAEQLNDEGVDASPRVPGTREGDASPRRAGLRIASN